MLVNDCALGIADLILGANRLRGRDVLEFLGYGEAGNLRASAVLPDEVYLL